MGVKILEPTSGWPEKPLDNADDTFTVEVYVRSRHPYSYRCNQWARVVGVAYLPERYGDHPRPGRPVYIVEWVDGKRDLLAVYDLAADYEFASGVRA